MAEFNQQEYIAGYKKDHYVRKEILFKKEDWENIIKPYLEKNKVTLKEIIMQKVK